MKVVAWPSIVGQELPERLRAIPNIDLCFVDNPDALQAAIRDAEAAVLSARNHNAQVAGILRDGAPRLRFIQLVNAGYENLETHGVPPGVLVANAGDSWSPAVAEHAMALLLAMVKVLPQAFDAQRRASWDQSFISRMDGLEGKTLVILGFGSIGREVARRARGFGMRIVGVSRSAKPSDLVDAVVPAHDMALALAQADVLLVAVPSSRQTLGYVGERELAQCKRGAYLVNIARGNVVAGDALANALESGHLAGAAIDVTEPEPLPDNHPLWSAPNLIVTPHVSGSCGAAGRVRLAHVVAGNIQRFAEGGRPLHLVTIDGGAAAG